MLRRYLLIWLITWTLGGAALIAAPEQVRAQSLDDLVDEATNFEDRVARLEEQYLKPAILESRYKLETRFNDARVAYMLGDYDRASLLFVDVVRDPRIEQFDSYREALYLLGDSLFKRRNFLSAKKYFQKLVDRGSGNHYQDAVVRLLEIAAKTGDYQGVDELYERFDREKEVGSGVQYMRGKTLFDQEKYTEAVPFFERAAEDPEWEQRARYFKGVCLAGASKYPEAREAFLGLARELDGADGQAREIRHLSLLGLGRVAYEQGNTEKAIDFYQRLPRSSEHFDRALYELTWALVSRNDYKAANRNADIFLYLSNPDPTFIPEVKLLKADLQLQLGRFDEATASYRELIDQFRPIRQRIAKFLDEREDPEEFFAELVEKEIAGDTPEYLPGKVQKWIDQSQEMQDVTQTVRDVSKLQQDVEETRQALDELEARLKSGSAIKSFPNLAEGMAVGIEAESQLIQLRQQLLEQEFALLEPHMDAGEKETWSQMRQELSTLQEQYEKVPKTVEEVRKREQNLQKRFEKLRERLDSISYALSGQKEQLQGVDEYIRENYDGELPENKRREVEVLRREVKERIAELEKRQKELRQQVSLVRQKIGVGDKVTKRERGLRKEYREKLAEHREFLDELHSRVGSQKRSKLRDIQRAREALPPAYARLQGFFDKMREIAGEKTSNLEETIAREREVLDEREQLLADLRGRSKETATRIAYQNFAEVKRKFDEIVLRGDVGLIDVAWQKKEEQTEAINQLRENRRSDLKSLQESFNEVR